MGKIQSAITGALLTSIGVTAKAKMDADKGEVEREQGKEYDLHGNTGNEASKDALKKRREEANKISEFYYKEWKNQRKELQDRMVFLKNKKKGDN